MSNSKGRAVRPARPRAAYCVELGLAACDHAARGLGLRALCRRKDMPSRASLEHWLETQPEFAEAFGLALAAGRATTVLGRPAVYDREVALALCARVAEGEALHLICQDPAMPAPAMLQCWLNRRPDFAAMFAGAREMLAQRLFDEVRAIADEISPATLQIDRLRITARQWQVARLAPRKLGEKSPVKEATAGAAAFNVEVVEF